MEVRRLEKPGGQRADPELLEEMLRKQTMLRKQSNNAKTVAVSQKRKIEDWEATGLAGIQKKGLSLDVSWTEKTWTNKATTLERLKLLKDDGIDITKLRKLGGNSAAISRAVLAHIAVRKQRPRVLQKIVEDLPASPDRLTDIPTSIVNSPPLISSHKRRFDDTLAMESAHTSTNLDDVADKETATVKRLCTAHLQAEKQVPKMKVEEIPTWNELKSHVLNDIFQPSQEPRTVLAPRSLSHITITFPPPASNLEATDELQLNSSGFECIMDELRVLSDSIDEERTTITIRIIDPAAPNAHAIVVRHTYNVFRNVPLRTVIEGDATALNGLLSRLSLVGALLMYMEKRCFDNTGARRDKGGNFELSSKTQQELKDIKASLEMALETGSAKVNVSCVTKPGENFGRRFDYDKVLY